METQRQSLRRAVPLSLFLVIFATQGCGSGPGPAVMAPPPPPQPSATSPAASVTPESPAVPSIEDATILADKKGLAPAHPMFEGLKAAASCDLTLSFDKRDACPGVQKLKKSLPSMRGPGDGHDGMDVSLIRMLSAKDASLRMAALLALDGLGGNAYHLDGSLAGAMLDLVAKEQHVPAASLWAEVLAGIQPQAGVSERMKKVVTDHPMIELRIKFLKAWGFRDKAVVPLAKEIAKHEDPDLRRAGIAALWARAKDDASVCPFWMAAAKDKDPQVEFTALDHVVRHCPAKAWGPALTHIEAAVKAKRTILGISNILTWAKNGDPTPADKKRIEAIDKAQTGENWIGDGLPDRAKK